MTSTKSLGMELYMQACSTYLLRLIQFCLSTLTNFRMMWESYPCQNSGLLDPVVEVDLSPGPLPHDVDDPVEDLVLQARVSLKI